MSYSNSSLNCFQNCMKKYEHVYILHTPPCKPPSPHLTFGTMAHEVLENAGRLRDMYNDRVLDKGDYVSVIPSEVLYPELKEEFNIKSWNNYFTPIIKKIAEYENELMKEGIYNRCEREFKFSISPSELIKKYEIISKEPLVGIIDFLLLGINSAVIIDYKFSSTRKTQDDFDMNSQLPLYALFVHDTFNIPLRNIKVGYIDIPKSEFDTPAILKNGTLSRAKNQNVDAEFYKQAVIAIHGDDPYYHCDNGGYYEEIYNCLKLNKPAYMNVQYLDMSTYKGITSDILDTIKVIEFMKETNMPFLKKYDSYSCKGCEYINSCKPWITVQGE